MMNKIRKLKEKKGFTLVELIVVIAIIAILTAVIVPLVGRYSAQATYTTLQDTAKTISNSCKNVISDVTMMGKTFSTSPITGKKDKGTLTITVGGKTATSADYTSKLTSTDEKEKVAAKLAEALSTALTSSDCSFCIEIATNTVSGVIYTNDATSITNKSLSSGTDKVTVIKLKSFENAYKLSSKDGVDIGIDGTYVSIATNET